MTLKLLVVLALSGWTARAAAVATGCPCYEESTTTTENPRTVDKLEEAMAKYDAAFCDPGNTFTRSIYFNSLDTQCKHFVLFSYHAYFRSPEVVLFSERKISVYQLHELQSCEDFIAGKAVASNKRLCMRTRANNFEVTMITFVVSPLN